MDYENMSDFEINKLVAEAIGCTIHGKRQGNPIIDSFTGRAFDPCNNVNDAWPIITENKIGGHWGKASPGVYFAVSGLEEFVVMDKNPLRAAMIVYLMMQEQEK
jgi:hypothetical protein